MATKRRSSAARDKGNRRPPPERSVRPAPLGLTLDRQLDLLGLALLILAAIALLSYLSPQPGILARPVLDLFRRAFGWGEYIAPLGLGAVGLWLLLRRFGEHLPRIRPERPIGLALTYLVALVTFTAAGGDGLPGCVHFALAANYRPTGQSNGSASAAMSASTSDTTVG